MENRLLLKLAVAIILHIGVRGSPMLTEVKVCVQTGFNTFVNLVCPADNMVIITQATYLRTREPGCDPGDEDACTASDISSQLTMPCFFRLGTCKIKLLVTAIPECQKRGVTYAGDPFFHVLYKCEPMLLSGNSPSQTADMCSHTRVTGSLVYLWNTNFPQYTLERTCRCMVTIGQHSQMEVKLPHFKAHHQEINGCPQVIHFWSGKEVHSLCSEVDDTFAPLEISVNSTLYIEFDNPLQQMTQFWISLRVETNKRMIVRCGADLIFPPRPMGPPPTGSINNYMTSTTLPPHLVEQSSTISTSTSTAWAQAGAGYSDNQYHHTLGYIPVIAGAVGATLLIVLTIMAIIFGLKQRRKHSPSQSRQPTIQRQADPDFAFDNDVYAPDGSRIPAHARQVPQPIARTRINPSSQHPQDTPASSNVNPSAMPHQPSSATTAAIDKTPSNSAMSSDRNRFVALEAPKGTVVQNPYAGLPSKSPSKSLNDILISDERRDIEDKRRLHYLSRHSVYDGEYEDLKDFNHSYYKTLAKQNEVTLDETVLTEP